MRFISDFFTIFSAADTCSLLSALSTIAEHSGSISGREVGGGGAAGAPHRGPDVPGTAYCGYRKRFGQKHDRFLLGRPNVSNGIEVLCFTANVFFWNFVEL